MHLKIRALTRTPCHYQEFQVGTRVMVQHPTNFGRKYIEIHGNTNRHFPSIAHSTWRIKYFQRPSVSIERDYSSPRKPWSHGTFWSFGSRIFRGKHLDLIHLKTSFWRRFLQDKVKGYYHLRFTHIMHFRCSIIVQSISEFINSTTYIRCVILATSWGWVR